MGHNRGIDFGSTVDEELSFWKAGSQHARELKDAYTYAPALPFQRSPVYPDSEYISHVNLSSFMITTR